ncbi:unnamed protein product [Cunninghamella blakesleeana]
MNLINTFLFGYFLGGLTLFPLLLALYVYLPNISLHNIPFFKQLKKKLPLTLNDKKDNNSNTYINSAIITTNTTATSTSLNNNNNNNNLINTNITSGPGSTILYKVGWLRMTHGSPPVISLKKPDQRLYFTVLKQHTLFLYDSEEQLDCQLVLSLNNYKVGVYPNDILDPELFSRPYWIQLKPLQKEKEENQQQQQPIYYFHCHVCTEKEDWFHILLQASGKPKLPQSMTLEPLIQVIHSNSHHLEVQWFNALLSRLFMGIHLTKKFHQSIEKKIMTKVDKINARKPPFLGEIQVRHIDIGKQNGSIPFITQPKLLSLSTQGECWLEAMMDYHGNNCTIEIATVLQWSYSDRLPPLTMDIVLSVSLQSIQGKFKLLIKPPPSNRLWYGFEGLPKMKWNIVPLVWEKKIGHSMVVKAIIKHLEEVFSDTMVLPHMDDTTFFDNGGSGGIYQDDLILSDLNSLNEQQQQQQNENNNNDNISDSDTVIEENHSTCIDQPYLKKSFSSSTSNMKLNHPTMIKNKNGTLYTSPTSISLPHLAMDTQKKSTSSSTTAKKNESSSASLPIPTKNKNKNNKKNHIIVKKSSTESNLHQKEKRNKHLPKIDHDHEEEDDDDDHHEVEVEVEEEEKKKKKKVNKKEQKKMKQQDMKLLSTVKSLPELISAHTNQHPSPHQKQPQKDENDGYFFLSTSPSHHDTSSILFSTSLSPPKFDDAQKQQKQPQQQSSSSTTTNNTMATTITTTTNNNSNNNNSHITTTMKSIPIFLSNSSSTTTTNTSSTAGTSSESASSITSCSPTHSDHKEDLSTSPNAPLPPPKLPPIPSSSSSTTTITTMHHHHLHEGDDQRPHLKPRKSLSHLTQKTTASSPITQVTPAAGVFLAKNLPPIKN